LDLPELPVRQLFLSIDVIRIRICHFLTWTIIHCIQLNKSILLAERCCWWLSRSNAHLLLQEINLFAVTEFSFLFLHDFKVIMNLNILRKVFLDSKRIFSFHIQQLKIYVELKRIDVLFWSIGQLHWFSCGF
jgi:hypothetical protein